MPDVSIEMLVRTFVRILIRDGDSTLGRSRAMVRTTRYVRVLLIPLKP